MRPSPRIAPASPFTGKTIGRCLIGRPVGRGATATVYHATYVPLKRSVAVKILRADSGSTPEARRKFIEEAKSLARLDHENVVRVFDVLEDGGYLLIIMDYVAGRSLKQVIDEDGAMDPGEAVEAARQIALALDHAHGARILHRDVKPGNVILRDDGRAVLVDFGNADSMGESGDRKGTAHYVAPEVFQGKRQDEKTDTYSLGATLFHMLTGEPPHDGGSVQEILEAHEAGKVRAPSSVNPNNDIPKELDTLVKRSMASARGYRFTAKDFADALAEVLAVVRSGEKRSRARKSRTRGAPARSTGLPPLVLLGGLLAVGAVAAAVAVHLTKEEKKPDVVLAPPKPVEKVVEAPSAPPEEKAPGPGIEKRAETRVARETAAEKALAAALDFAALNPGKPKDVAAKFAAVADEYAELAQGRRAREELAVWKERAIPEAELVARKEKAAREEKLVAEKRAEAMKRVSSFIGALKFPEALVALDEVEAPPGKHDEWKLRKERLNNLFGFAELLAEGLKEEPIDAYFIRQGLGKPGEKIVGASEEGLLMKSAGGDRTIPWGETKAADVLAIGRKVLRNAPEPRLALACWCFENDLADEGRKEIDNAMLTDRTGTVPARIEELFGPQ